MTEINVVFEPTIFMQHQEPEGYLNPDAACHGLWYYYINAITQQSEVIDDPIYYEGDAPPTHNLFALFANIAVMYGVTPERMLKFWPNVEAQALKMHMPVLRDEFKWKDKPEVRTQ